MLVVDRIYFVASKIEQEQCRESMKIAVLPLVIIIFFISFFQPRTRESTTRPDSHRH